MMEKLIPEGEIIIFTEGDYEDYNVIGLYQAIQDIPPDVINRYVKPERQFSRYESVEAITKLVAMGYARKLNAIKVNIGSYNMYDPEIEE